MNQNPMNQTIFELRAAVVFMVVILLLLGSYTQKKADEAQSLKESMDLLETSIEQQKTRNQQRFDSLQQLIQEKDQLHQKLKDSLTLLKVRRHQLKAKSDENKAAITRIRDADSLYRAIARHYR